MELLLNNNVFTNVPGTNIKQLNNILGKPRVQPTSTEYKWNYNFRKQNVCGLRKQNMGPQIGKELSIY